MNNDSQEIAASLAATLERAWNTGDGEGFGRPFAVDADFIDIRGDHHRTRDAIAKGHQTIFDTVYNGSVVRLQVAAARAVAPGVLIVHIKGALKVPGGPLAGEYRSTATLTLVQSGAEWQIAAFHNMLVKPETR